jgi:hypothetical protein
MKLAWNPQASHTSNMVPAVSWCFWRRQINPEHLMTLTAHSCLDQCNALAPLLKTSHELNHLSLSLQNLALTRADILHTMQPFYSGKEYVSKWHILSQSHEDMQRCQPITGSLNWILSHTKVPSLPSTHTTVGRQHLLQHSFHSKMRTNQAQFVSASKGSGGLTSVSSQNITHFCL